MSSGVRGAVREWHRILKEATGEAKWDDYLAECRSTGTEPMSRREFERHRAHQQECTTRMRCC